MAKKDLWVVKLVREDLTLEHTRNGSFEPRSFPNKKQAIDAIVHTARILYYNTVLGTSLTVDDRVNLPHGTRVHGKILLNKSAPIPHTITTKEGMVFERTVMGYVYDPVASKRSAEALLDKITKRYAKYIEDEEYWQDVFKQQAAELAAAMAQQNGEYDEA